MVEPVAPETLLSLKNLSVAIVVNPESLNQEAMKKILVEGFICHNVHPNAICCSTNLQ